MNWFLVCVLLLAWATLCYGSLWAFLAWCCRRIERKWRNETAALGSKTDPDPAK